MTPLNFTESKELCKFTWLVAELGLNWFSGRCFVPYIIISSLCIALYVHRGDRKADLGSKQARLIAITKKYYGQIANLFGTRDRFRGRQFFHGLWVEGWFRDDSSTLPLLCTLFLLLLYQLHLRSSGIRSRGLGPPGRV